METNVTTRTTKMVELALLIAIVILMAFTPIGYIKTLGLEITLLAIPVTVGAIALGPISGAILGGVFGITSFIQCFGMSPFGAVLLGINPVGTLIVCLIPRILMGWLSGLVFKGLQKGNTTRKFSFAITSLVGPILNTLFFMTTLVLFFYNTDYIQGFATALNTKNVFTFIILFAGVNGLVEAGICFILGTAISKALSKFRMKAGK